MHDEILNADQLKLLPLMARFRREYYLVGGTAIALHIGHRRSVDFDMFKMSAINHKKNLDKIVASGFDHQVTRRVEEQMNLLVNGVKLTFFQYPFPVVPELFGELFSENYFAHSSHTLTMSITRNRLSISFQIRLQRRKLRQG